MWSEQSHSEWESWPQPDLGEREVQRQQWEGSVPEVNEMAEDVLYIEYIVI